MITGPTDAEIRLTVWIRDYGAQKEPPFIADLTEVLRLVQAYRASECTDALHEKSYRQGYVDAVANYAIWNDGVQYVGALRRDLKDVLAEFAKLPIPVRY